VRKPRFRPGGRLAGIPTTAIRIQRQARTLADWVRLAQSASGRRDIVLHYPAVEHTLRNRGLWPAEE